MSQEEGVEEVFLKPGQKFATPSPGNGDRVFYETLLQQRPDSEMAQEWCLFYGILETSDAHALYLRYCKRKNIQPKSFAASPQKKSSSITTTTTTTSTSAAAPASKKRRGGNTKGGEDFDADTGVSGGKVWESASIPM